MRRLPSPLAIRRISNYLGLSSLIVALPYVLGLSLHAPAARLVQGRGTRARIALAGASRVLLLALFEIWLAQLAKGPTIESR